MTFHAWDATMAQTTEFKIGGRYNWRNQPERLIYTGTKVYLGDRRTWFQFEKVGEPGVIWGEYLESDLAHIEETKE
jgi:hypothetical protein